MKLKIRTVCGLSFSLTHLEKAETHQISIPPGKQVARIIITEINGVPPVLEVEGSPAFLVTAKPEEGTIIYDIIGRHLQATGLRFWLHHSVQLSCVISDPTQPGSGWVKSEFELVNSFLQ